YQTGVGVALGTAGRPTSSSPACAAAMARTSGAAPGAPNTAVSVVTMTLCDCCSCTHPGPTAPPESARRTASSMGSRANDQAAPPDSAHTVVGVELVATHSSSTRCMVQMGSSNADSRLAPSGASAPTYPGAGVTTSCSPSTPIVQESSSLERDHFESFSNLCARVGDGGTSPAAPALPGSRALVHPTPASATHSQIVFESFRSTPICCLYILK